MIEQWLMVAGVAGVCVVAAWLYVKGRSDERQRAREQELLAREQAATRGRAVEAQHVEAAAAIEREFEQIRQDAQEAPDAPTAPDSAGDRLDARDIELWNRANAAVAAAADADGTMPGAAAAGVDGDHQGAADQSHRGDAPVRTVRPPSS